MREKSQSFAAGAAVLMAAALVVKVIGALFKIPLTRILGGGGMGYFMTAYGFFNPIYALSVAGFPVAVSRLTARSVALGRRGDADKILNTALLLFPAIGLALSAAIYFGAGTFVSAVGNPAAHRAVLAIAPAVFFCCITAVFRGHFEGKRNMVPTAFSQVAEAVVKLGAGIYFAISCVDWGYRQYQTDKIVFDVAVDTLEQAQAVIAPYAAAAAVAGVTVSTAAGCLFIALRYAFAPRRTFGERSDAHYAAPLLKMALPVCLGALVVNLTSMIDLVSVMNSLARAVAGDFAALAAGYPNAGLDAMPREEIPNFLFGSYSGLAVTVFNLVPALTATLGVCALPMVSAMAAKGNRARLRAAIEAVLRITAVVAVPMGMGLAVMAQPILSILFSGNPAEVAVAVKLLRPLGAAAVFVSAVAPINSMLQAMGRVYTPVRLMLVGGCLKLVINLALVRIPSVNIFGAPWGTIACYLFLMLAGCRALTREDGGDINLVGIFARPLAAGAACCAAAYASHRLLGSIIFNEVMRLLISMGLGAVCYLAGLAMLRALPREDFVLFLSDSKFTKILENIGVIR